jgi:hypothetical protein
MTSLSGDADNDICSHLQLSQLRCQFKAMFIVLRAAMLEMFAFSLLSLSCVSHTKA